MFFNTPVRYKFLKKDYTESGYIEDTITRIALVNPNIAIKLINTGKTVIQTNGNGDLKSVVYSIYGKDVANGIMELNYQYEDVTVSGVIGKPEIARSNRSNQLFFVNKRYIKDKILTAATEQSYKGLIPIGKFGFVILNLEMNPAKVDVNVHPAKLEVRFEEENKIFQSIYHAIKDTLLKNELVANTEKSARELSFEERLKTIREAKKENQNTGLFGFRKQSEKQIEKYTEEESSIKTNTIEEVTQEPKIQVGAPIDTTDVLNQLKEMKEKIAKELEQKSEQQGTLEDVDTEYKLEQKEEIKEEEIESKQEEQTTEEATKEVEEKNSEEEIVQETNQEETEKEEVELQEQAEEVIEKIEDPEIQKEFEEIKQKMQDLNDNPEVVSKDFNEMYAKMFGRLPIEEEKKIEEQEKQEEQKTSAVDIIKDNISVFEQTEQFQKPTYKFIGIVFNTYIILEIDKEMYILVQHAAHERIMYEKVKKNYYSETNKDSQMLLLPDVITLSHKEMDIAKENMEMFKQAGFSLEEFGENTIKLNGVPTVCIDLNTKELFLETLDEINTVARTAKQEKEEKFIATVACKAAVKANMALNPKEVEVLMDKLLELPNPFTCPHGRPTVIKMTKYDIERKFARK